MRLSPKAERRITLAAIAVCFAIGLGGIWWLCERDPKINFLSAHGKASWIIYPNPPNAVSFNDLETVAVFRHSFQLDHLPNSAVLNIRAFRRYQISLNGVPAPPPAKPASNWKDATQLEVAPLLHVGTNEILVTVFNHNSPPALWLSLEAGAMTVTSSADWKASLLGAAWRNAWPASAPMKFEKGNPLAGGEFTMDCLHRSLPALICFALIAGVATFIISKFLTRLNTADGATISIPQLGFKFVIVLGVFWTLLFVNNLKWLPHELGYDARAHIDYIDYIRDKSALPLANEGWEMYQPPLYYLVGAGITSASGAVAASDRAATALRIFGALVGVIHILTIFLGLRLLFPDRLGAQCFGSVLAACLPEHLYISQYVTNEFLAAAFVTGALYFCLRLQECENNSAALTIAVGACLGAALLTKFTAVLVVPFIAGTFILRIYRAAPASGSGPHFKSLALCFGTTIALAGWHYLRVWQHFGTPVVANWDPGSGYSWWMDKGFQTAGSMTGFGQSLIQPRFSAFHGFWDGIYSTLWGDALDGGAASLENRPPWDYDLMTGGFLLALVPTLIILIGLVAGAVNFFRRPSAAWFLVLGVLVTTYAALIYLNLKVPYYGNAKAFYALMTLLPMCACGAAGWETLNRFFGKFRYVLHVAVGIWALNVYATFWVRGGAPATHVTRGSYFMQEGLSEKSITEFQKALTINSRDVIARTLLATEFADIGNLDASRRETAQVLTEAPEHPAALMQLALLQASEGHLDQAIQTIRHINDVAPDFALAYEKLCRGMMQIGKYPEAAEAAREALRITPFRAEIHLLLGVALTSNGEHQEADQHLQLASDLKPGWAQARDQLGLCLQQLGLVTNAIMEFKQACRLRPDLAQYALHLGDAYARNGQFDEAITSISQAVVLAEKNHDSKTLNTAQKMLEAYKTERLSHPETAVPNRTN